MIRSLEEADIALKEAFSGIIIDSKAVPVVFVNPQAQFTPKQLPCIVLSQSGDYNDAYRDENQVIVLGESIVSGKRLQEKTRPEPISIYYVVRLYASKHSQQTALKDGIRHILKRGACVTLGGRPYPLTQISYRNPSGNYSDFGEQKDNEQRLFIDQYLIKVATQMIHDTAQHIVVEHTKISISIKE